MIVLAVAAGGGIGAVLRWAADASIPRRSGFPVGITLVNVLGSLMLGVVVGYEVADGVLWLTPFTVGVLGGFTTFSTWMVDIDAAVSIRSTLAVAILPLIVGLGAALLGVAVGSALG